MTKLPLPIRLARHCRSRSDVARFAGTALFLLPSMLIPAIASADIPLFAIGTDVTGGGLAGVWAQACTYLPYCYSSTTTLSGMELLGAIIGNAVLWIIGSVAVCAVIYGAIRIITSAGDQEKITAGKKAVQYGLIGLLIALIANEVMHWICLLLFKMGGTGPFCQIP